MAGLGRRSCYRKHLTDTVMYDFPEPQSDERIAKVVATRGGNQFDVMVASVGDSSRSEAQLAILPTKFRKLVWVKRGDFVIVMTGAEPDEEAIIGEEESKKSSGIRFMINHILYKEQVKHLKSKDLWPSNDPEFADTSDLDNGNDDEQAEYGIVDDDDDDEDGIVHDTGYGEDDDLFVNTNRVANLRVQDSSSSESDNDAED